MYALGLKGVEQALDQKADQIQREFISASNELSDLNRKILEATSDEERQQIRERQKHLREHQQQMADDVNEWREKARSLRTQPGEAALRKYLNELREFDDPLLNPAIEHALYVMDASDEELEALASQEVTPAVTTQAGRLIQRARTEYDMRGADPGARQRAAVEFANRQGVAQRDEVVTEIESFLDDPDPMVKETAILTAIQLHKFRAMRVADLDQAHDAVQKLAALNHLAAVPVLVEVLENPRTGFTQAEGGAHEVSNNRSRMVALLRLIEWHTPEAKLAVHKIQFDRDPDISSAAKRALELFPEVWEGPIKGKGHLPDLEAS